ncbi:hypothetical protein GIB67_025325 [Kingdonia uniflora]|uniref:30S ribosomal protein S9 n=1 Tax=Kingdonia uniflora TaxID=39325 RepID=A0A7J7NB59_9MAGN|nr:hypothetical protein GIB67_025325 [Kingdonia uniflora]
MLSRFISRPSNLRFLKTLISSNPSHSHPSLPPQYYKPFLPSSNFKFFSKTPKHFSTNRNNNGDDPTISNSWDFTPKNDNDDDFVFGDDEDVGLKNVPFVGPEVSGDGVDGFKPWSFGDEEKDEVFDLGDGFQGIDSSFDDGVVESKPDELSEELKKEKEKLQAKLKGKNRVFGDLIEASGITEAMVDTLTSLRDLEHLGELPALTEIEDKYRDRDEIKAKRAQMEREKQEIIDKSRVREVDENGRAYGTGRRKCSIARVWIQPGDGNFVVNGKQFDFYFPMLDQRAALLSPFVETKTLGLWDVKCTVKGGGTSG